MFKFVKERNGFKTKFKLKKVSTFDSSSCLYLTELLAMDRATTKSWLEKVDKNNKVRLREAYNTQDNNALLRKIFCSFLKRAIKVVVSGQGTFMLPFKGNGSAKIFVGFMPDELVKKQRQEGKLKYFDMLQTNYRVPLMKYRLSKSSLRPPMNIYINRMLYAELVETANKGFDFPPTPRKLDFILKDLQDEFSLIKPDKIKNFIIHATSLLHKAIRAGEEVRILDTDGEIRFYHPFFGYRRRNVIKSVVKKRIMERFNKKLESYAKH
jgi:hypothetical protein